MYIKRKEVISGNKIKLIEDLEFLMNEDGFNTIIRFNQEKERGKVFFANRGTTFWSFNCTNYQNLDSESGIIEYDSGDENSNGYKTGGFKIFINSSYDLNQTVSTQQKIPGTNTFDSAGIAAIPRNNIFSYEIYSSLNGWDWGIITKFEDMTFFCFWGDKSKGTELVGNYSFSSFPIGSARISIPYDFNNESSSIVSGNTPTSPFEGLGTNNSVFFCYYTDETQNEIEGLAGEMNVETTQSGETSQNALAGIYNNFYNEFSGLSQIVNLEIFVNSGLNTFKKYYDLDFGYANLNKANSLDVKTINGERIKFIVNGRKEKVMNINNRASYNNLIFWFKVK